MLRKKSMDSPHPNLVHRNIPRARHNGDVLSLDSPTSTTGRKLPSNVCPLKMAGFLFFFYRAGISGVPGFSAWRAVPGA